MTPRILRHEGWDEVVLNLAGGIGESANEALLKVVSAAHRLGADVLRAVGFALVCPEGVSLEAPRGVPATFVEGAPCTGGAVAGIQATAARGGALTFYEIDPPASVTVLEDACARWAYISGITPDNLWAPPDAQARQAFEKAEAALDMAGMGFTSVFRTWLYVDDILSWYDELNRVRTEFFRERGVFDGVVPASTGIGAANPSGAALTLDILAVAPRGVSVSVIPVPSPLQCPALEYGSSFSRAVEVAEPGLRRLLVSGTASIALDGATAWPGDVEAQTDRTLDVVEAILRSREMDWPDVNRAVAYFRAAEDAPALGRCWKARGGPALPVIETESVICRDDLLFEIEVDAAAVG